ncbi:hypothetical protein DYB34_010929 [Aphanomyces astaci]|uniref:Crossover junction endonuclease MUS81-like HHH domain-containing protein n=3 Tax=Aphanomyces astaci TaxID=112090 RepID=A0A418BKY9_APHAT|nr:hypothetical protein DYB34_010929 [Aphanomyces astaci]
MSYHHKQKAENPKNEKLAQAFDDLAAYEFQHGGLNTAVGASYSKIAMAIRDVDDEITSGEVAMNYRDIGPKTAAMIDEYFEKGEISKPPTKEMHVGHHHHHHGKESSHHKTSHHRHEHHGKASPRNDDDDEEVESLRHKMRSKLPATNPKNHELANAFEDLAEYDFHRGQVSAGAAYSKVAMAIRDARQEITSGQQAFEEVDGIGQKSAAKIDEYLEMGHIAKSDEGSPDEEEEEGTSKYHHKKHGHKVH